MEEELLDIWDFFWELGTEVFLQRSGALQEPRCSWYLLIAMEDHLSNGPLLLLCLSSNFLEA